MSADPTREADILALIAEPKELPDTHRAIAYLMHHKHQHAIVSTLVKPGTPKVDRYAKLPPNADPTIRRWELLPGYTPQQVADARIRGRVAAAEIEHDLDRNAWVAALKKIEHPLIRDTAADVLRGWW